MPPSPCPRPTFIHSLLFLTRESVSRYKQPLRLCMRNKILRSANVKINKSRGGSRIFFRRGCTRLLLYFKTNKSHSFSFFAEYHVTWRGGVRTPCTLPLDPRLKRDLPLMYSWVFWLEFIDLVGFFWQVLFDPCHSSCYYEESDRGQTITARKPTKSWIHTKKHRNLYIERKPFTVQPIKRP